MKKLSITEIIDKANKKHLNKYCYDLIDNLDDGIHTKAKIICPKHGVFEQSLADHLSGKGCQKCYDERRGKTLKKSNEQFITECTKLYKDYEYDKVKYVNSHTPVIITCKKHGEFKRKPSVLLMGNGCPKCKHEKLFEENQKKFIIKSNILHNNFYSYNKVFYKGNKIKVIITCPIHGDFEQKPNDHICGHGCPICGNTNKTELLVKNELKKYFNNIEYHKKFTWLKYKKPLEYDFYLPEYNTAIEYQGRQHFLKMEHFNNEYEIILKRDLEKIKLSKENGVRLFHISYETKFLPDDFKYYTIYNNIEDVVYLIKNDKTTI